MWSKAFDWIVEYAPGVALILFVIIVTAYACIKASKFYYTRFKKTEDISDKVKDLPEAVNRNTENIEKQVIPKLDSISKALRTITSILYKKEIIDKTDLFEASSPVKLTKTGMVVLELIGGKQYVDDNSERLVQLMKEQNYKSALDVQNQANLLILEQAGTDDFVPIKDFIYQNPKYKDVALDMSTVVPVMGIYLRDKYFQKYPAHKDTE